MPILKRALPYGLLFLLSFGLFAGAAASARFDGLYGQDPFAYYDYGRQIQALITHGQGLGRLYYPLGYPMLLSAAFLLGGTVVTSAQIVTMLCGAALTTLAALLTVEIARALGIKSMSAFAGGLAAWAVLTASGQVIQSSIVIMSDIPALMWATLSAWALAIYARTQRPGWLMLSAFGLAWATMTRWNFAALTLPWALVCLLIWRGGIRFRHAAFALVVGAATFAPQAVYSLQNSGPLLHNPAADNWSPANALKSAFVTADGTAIYDEPVARYYLKPLTSPYFLTVGWLPLVLIGLLVVRKRGPLVVLLIGWVAVQYGFLAGLTFENIRYGLAYFPPLAVLIGLAVAWLASVPFKRQFRLTIWVSVALIGVGLLFGTLSTASGLIANFVEAKNQDLAAVRWLESSVPEPGASVYMLDLLEMTRHYSPTLKPIQIYYETPQSLAARLPNDQPAYALFNVWTTEHQWRGKIPWQIYHWLLDGPGLTEIGSESVYTLYRVGK